jgi:2-dehydro-3-deoxyglucarate aldolase/4-hydroxy-2-oxoheptanedioate aldolase
VTNVDLESARELRTAIRDGEPVVGGWVSIAHPSVAEITAAAGPDFVTIDTEHAAIGIETVEDAVRGVETANGALPFVRVPAADPVPIKRVLDAGAAGVMVPRVETVADAELVAAATTYPPDGMRGTAGGRASAYGTDLDDHLSGADDAVTRIVQVETETAVANAADLAAVDGVDALFVGPADLSTALGVPLDYDATPFREAVESVVGAAGAAGVPTGIFVTDPERIDDWLSLGFDFAIVGYDAAFLRSGTEEMVDAFDDVTERSTDR